MNAADIAAILKAKPSGKGWRARCPAHKDKSPSLWFSDAITEKNKTGILRFQCKAGCDYRDIRYALGIQQKSSCTPMNGAYACRMKSEDSVDDDPLGQIVRWRKLHKVWDQSVPIIEGSPAWTYLVKTRRVLKAGQPIPSVMREIPDLAYWTSGEDDELIHVGNFPAIISRLDDVNGDLATLHRTYLAHDGSGKAPVEKAKKLMQSPVDGCTDGAAIQLFGLMVEGDLPNPANSAETVKRVILGVSEGIESALAAYTKFGYPTWAAWSASGLAKLEVPAVVTDLLIFGDNDTAGRKAVNDLCLRLKEESPKLRFEILFPSTPGADWADEILK